MDYEKKYREALEEAEKIHKFSSDIAEIKRMEQIFPELKESEDERIRKEIISHLQYLAKYCNESMPNVDKWITWLEEQGEQKPASKMQVSEKLYEHIRNTYAYIDDALSSKTLADITDYLVMANKDAQSAFDMIEKQGEQKSVIEIKTPEESLGISSEEYNKIVDECIYGDDKSAWSEEDEKMVKDIIAAIDTLYYHGMVNWLKSLKERVKPQWKPSEEQIEILRDAIVYIESCNSNFKGSGHVLELLYEDLKKLKDGYTREDLYCDHWSTYKDTFIEKAVEWLREQDEMIGISFTEDFIIRFKNYMEGE